MYARALYAIAVVLFIVGTILYWIHGNHDAAIVSAGLAFMTGGFFAVWHRVS